MTGLPPALERLPAGVLHVGLQGQIRGANACLGVWLGQATEALVGQSMDNLLSRAGRVLYHTHLVPTLRLHGEVQELSLSLRGAAGTVQVLCSARLQEDPAAPDGPLAELVLSPMRERQRIETELARVQRAADAAPIVLLECVCDVDGQCWISYASAGLVSLYGLTAEQVQFSDRPWLDCVHEADRPGLIEQRQASSRSMAIWTAQFRARAGAGQWRWHRIHAQPYAAPDGRTVWFGAIVDVTEQVAVEDAARERDAAERANRSKSEFLARMSHELRTPLNAIIGFSQLLEETPGCHEGKTQQQLGIIHAAGKQLLHLIDDVLDIARVESGQLRVELAPVRLAPLLADVCLTHEPARLARDQQLSCTADAELAAFTDETRLRQVLNNLISNALKYTPPGGRIAVQASGDGDRVQLQVRDNGPGLSAQQQQHLFQPFNRLGAERSAVQGTGLGLVITRQLVESLGGALRLSSSEGQGCCFTVDLPRAAPRAPAAAAPQDDAGGAPQPAPGRRRWRLLYAEDDPVNALLMETVLARLPDVSLRIAANGQDACDLARAQTPDLLLLDLSLPDMDGRALLARLRAEPALADVPAVAVSADAMPEEVQRTLAAGFTAYWSKPLNVGRLPADVHALLARTAPRQP